MTFDNKDDLRTRMLDLESKLAESEEERSKLEKTCNALIKALREEEKMWYKVLNKKYEKFLQDCTVRKRRNNNILRSLGRIEDRSKALFAKTERLKLLKDRYISYLKINDAKKGEISSALAFPLSTSFQKNINYISSKYIQWKPPLIKDNEVKKLEGNLFVSHKNLDVNTRHLNSGTIYSKSEIFIKKKSKETPNNEENVNERIFFNNTFHDEVSAITSTVKNKLNLDKTKLDFIDSLENSNSAQLKSEELIKTNTNNHKKAENDSTSKFDVKNVTEALGNVVSYQESVEKPKNVFSLEEQYFDDESLGKRQDAYTEKIVERDESYEKNSTKNQNSANVVPFRINYSLETFHSKVTAESQGKFEIQEENVEEEMKPDQVLLEGGWPKNTKSLPMGLDGIDFQNETYPESYYEQPVHHHSHTSIVADVILEEDETEPDGEEEKKDFVVKSNFGQTQSFQGDSHKSSMGEWISGRRTCSDSESNNKGAKSENADGLDRSIFEPFDEIKSQELDSEKSSEKKQSTTSGSKSIKSGSLSPEKSDRNKPPIKSNLLHLLESDSESFQIEHGDIISENEGSDFDFSIH